MTSIDHTPTGGRIIAIGDIHGCAHALDALLDAIRPTSNDTVISLGDFVDTGRDTAVVIDLLIELESSCRFIALMGNHEEMLLAALTSEKMKNTWLMCGGMATLMSYHYGADIDVIPEEHLEFIRRCRDHHETERHIFVHANYLPDVPLEDHPLHVLRWSLFEEPYPEPHCSGKKVVVGHAEQHSGEILDIGHAMCIDTRCHAYGWLTAVDVTSGAVWQASRWGVLREGEDLAELSTAKRMLSH